MESGNILLNQIIKDSIKEIIPRRDVSSGYLSIDENNMIKWIPKDEHFKHFNFYHKEGRIGLGREPLFTYKFDIKVDPDVLTTALHIGDGSAGFSFGNGTSNGFIPEIIGLGINKNDAGLYFLGKTNCFDGSNIPLIILDGRGPNGSKLTNRPILGITSADYLNYDFIINNDGKVGINTIPKIYNLEVGGIIQGNDIRIVSKTLVEKAKQYIPSINEAVNISLVDLLLAMTNILKKQGNEIARLKKQLK